MSLENSRSVVGRRGELLAELFLQELNPVFISRPTTKDLGYDLLVGFPNEKDGINTFAVEVKSMEKPPGSSVTIPRSIFHRIAHSNVPGLLLVADVKRNRLFYAWLRPGDSKSAGTGVSIPVTEISETSRRILKRQLENAEPVIAAAG